MTKKTRRKFSSDFKAKVVLEAFKERSTIEDLARKYELHPTQINNWKKEAVANMASVFGGDKTEDQSDAELQKEKLYAQIGQLKVENDFLKKKLWAFDDGPYIANVDFLMKYIYDPTYYSSPNIWLAEGYLNKKME